MPHVPATDTVNERRFASVTASGLAALNEALVADDVSVDRIEHVRTAHYAVFRVTSGHDRLLARVGTGDQAADQAFEIALAATLSRLGAPVAPPAPGIASALLTTDTHSVSLWDWLDNDPTAPLDGYTVGAVLAAIHWAGRQVLAAPDQVTVSSFKAPAKIRLRLDALEATSTIDPMALCLLADELDRRAHAADALSVHAAPQGLIHGDYQPGNLLNTDDGLVVIDWETACHGPLHWDLTTLEGRCRRGQYPGLSFTAILDGYQAAGGPILDNVAFDALCRLRDLSTAVWAYNEHRLDPSDAHRERAERLLYDLFTAPARTYR